MDVNPSQIVNDIGKQLLSDHRPNKDFIVKCLRKATDALSEIEQSASLKSILSPFTDALVKRELLHHKDKDVKLLLSTCLIEIIRVLAPEPLFKDNILRDIFKLIFCIFMELADTKSPYFSRRVKIVETFSELKFSLQMLDIGCDDLVLEMFNIFFNVVREQHPQILISAILSIMTQILKEETSQSLMEVILRNILKEGKEGERAASSSLAVAIIKSCSKELEPLIHCFLSSCILDRDSVASELKDFYHELIFEIFQSDPQMLMPIIPNLTQELLIDQVDTRIKAVNLIGKLFALPNLNFMQEYRPLFVEFLKRFFDKSTEVRLNVLQCAKACYLSNPSGPQSVEVLTAIEGRLVDFDDRVRAQAVTVVCLLARSNLKNIPPDLISRAVGRLRDKKISVRKNAMPKLLEVYKHYCILCSEGHMGVVDHFEQIPCKILMLSYDKDCTEFRPQNLEAVLAEDLFPVSLSVEEQTRHWIYLFSLFNSAHVKALNSILSQKQRLQKEMKNYVNLREKLKITNSEDMQKKIEASLLKMSAFFPDSNVAVESFRKLNQIKENTIFASLSQLMDGLSTADARNLTHSFVKSLGDKHPQLEFLRVLARKLCYNIFTSDHIRCIIDGICVRDFESKNSEEHYFSILKAVINFFPSLLRGSEKNLEELLLDENNPYSEYLVQILAKAGPYISTKLSEVYHLLEKLCLEGTRSQSKNAVAAIASLSDSESVFSRLFKKLLDYLPCGKCIPTLLQSLGCVAQHSSLRLPFGPKEFLEYMEDVTFRAYHGKNSDDMSSVGDSDCSISLKTKVFALKAVVKSFLPLQGNSNEEGFPELLEFLLNILQSDSLFYVQSSNSESTCLKLAAVKAVLRLSRRWDLHIHPEVFRCTIMMAKHEDPGIRKSFLEKLHSFLQKRVLPIRYACAFSFAPPDGTGLENDFLRYMAEFVRDSGERDQTLRDFVKQGGLVTETPVYVLVYLVHVLAHDPSFPPETHTNVDTCVQFLRPLWSALSCLLNVGSIAGNAAQVEDVISYSLLFFHAIKKAEDAVDSHYTFRLHFLADIGISLLQVLGRNKGVLVRPQGSVLLPSSFYGIRLANTCDEASQGDTPEYPAREEFIKEVVKFIEVEVSRLDEGSKEGMLPKKDQNNHRRQLPADKATAPAKGGGTRTVNGSSVRTRTVSKSSVLNPVDGNSKLGAEKIKKNVKKGRDSESQEGSVFTLGEKPGMFAHKRKGSFSPATTPTSTKGAEKRRSVSSDTMLSEIINVTDDIIARRTRQRLKVV